MAGYTLTQAGMKVCNGKDGPAACGSCGWKLISEFKEDNKDATVLTVVEYLKNNERWLGKYKGKDDRSVFFLKS